MSGERWAESSEWRAESDHCGPNGVSLAGSCAVDIKQT